MSGLLGRWLAAPGGGGRAVRTLQTITAAPRIDGSKTDTGSDDYAANYAAMEALVADMRSKVDVIKQGGGPRYNDKHKARGKLLARERVNTLLDPGTPFLELSQFAGYELYGNDHVPAGGIVTGIGRVQGCVREEEEGGGERGGRRG